MEHPQIMSSDKDSELLSCRSKMQSQSSQWQTCRGSLSSAVGVGGVLPFVMH